MATKAEEGVETMMDVGEGFNGGLTEEENRGETKRRRTNK